MKTIKRIASALAVTVLILPAYSAFADDASERVQVASLKVKERLQSIEQINVTAEKEQQQVAPESDAVAKLLREAEEIDEAGRAAQSTAH